MAELLWMKTPASRLDCPSPGRVQRAWRHDRCDALLLLHRPLARGADWHDRIGVWTVTCEGSLVRRRPVFGRTAGRVPLRWASGALRRYRGRAAGQSCPLLDGRRPTVGRSVAGVAPAFDELPPTLFGDYRAACPSLPEADPDGPAVPTAMATVPPRRLLHGRWAQCVLARDEYLLFLDAWRAWTGDHPELRDAPDGLCTRLCMAEVLAFRFLKAGRRPFAGRAAALYHRNFLRTQRLRSELAATCVWR